jgi:hypothetical protein
MSIGEFATAEAALSEQPSSAGKKKPPRARQLVATSDPVAQPEPR